MPTNKAYFDCRKSLMQRWGWHKSHFLLPWILTSGPASTTPTIQRHWCWRWILMCVAGMPDRWWPQCHHRRARGACWMQTPWRARASLGCTQRRAGCGALAQSRCRSAVTACVVWRCKRRESLHMYIVHWLEHRWTRTTSGKPYVYFSYFFVLFFTFLQKSQISNPLYFFFYLPGSWKK